MKILISIDEPLLKRIDGAAQREGLSRSAWIRRVVGESLGTEKGPGADRRARATFRRLDRLFARAPFSAEDSTSAIRTERDAR